MQDLIEVVSLTCLPSRLQLYILYYSIMCNILQECIVASIKDVYLAAICTMLLAYLCTISLAYIRGYWKALECL